MSNENFGFDYQQDADGIVTITMDLRGPVNSMTDDFRSGLAVVVDKLENQSGLTGVVLASNKKTFFAGADLIQLVQAKPGEESEWFNVAEHQKELLRRLEKLEVPIVAAINGAALGGGLELCLACNYRIALDESHVRLGFPEVNLGLLPGVGGVVRSIHMLGLQAALPILLEGRRYKVAQALELKLIDEVVSDRAELLPAAKQWIKSHSDQWQQAWDKKGHKIPGGGLERVAVSQVLQVAPAMVYQKTRGLMPAPERILSVAHDVLVVDFDTAMRIETRSLIELIFSAQAKNLITSTFIQLNGINSGASRPQQQPPSPVKKLAILGAGMMGQGIAYVSAKAGIKVVLKDVTLEAAEKGKSYSEKLLAKQVKKQRLSQADAESILANIHPTDSYEDLDGCDLIVEAVFENIGLKGQVTKDAEPYLKGGVFGTNTSTLPISLLAEASVDASKFIGIHFFSPVDKMPLVEIICGKETSDEALAKAFDFTLQIGKTPIVINDSLGFFTSRVFSTFLDEGAKLLLEGVDPILIDAMGKNIGMPVGPLAIQDEVSQELSRKVAETQREMGVYGSISDTDAAVSVSEKLIKDFGRGGRYHGGGYYDYGDGGEKTLWSKLYDLYYKPDVVISQRDMKDRLLFRQVIESLKCLEEGVLRTVADGNIGSIMGIGAPPWTGGFIQFVNTYGLPKFISRCEALATQYGERFNAPAIVREYEQNDRLFL